MTSKSTTIKQFYGIVRWSLIRHKYLLPAFSLVQVILALAVVYGLALLTPEIDGELATYLSSGAISLGIIAVGCVLAPQIASNTKQNGIFEYQRVLPVPRILIFLGDVIIWSLASLPGVLMGFIASSLRFDLTVDVGLLGILAIILIQVTMISIGFAIAYWLTPNTVSMVTQLIMIGSLLFSPITYPAERLPEWSTYLYNALPFVPASNMIRYFFFSGNAVSMMNLVVVILWMLVSSLLAVMALSRKG